MCADHIMLSRNRNGSFSHGALKMRLQSQGAAFSLSQRKSCSSISLLFFKPYQTELSMPIVIKEIHHLDNQRDPEPNFLRRAANPRPNFINKGC